jgi:hypothetical protein
MAPFLFENPVEVYNVCFSACESLSFPVRSLSTSNPWGDWDSPISTLHHLFYRSSEICEP